MASLFLAITCQHSGAVPVILVPKGVGVYNVLNLVNCESQPEPEFQSLSDYTVCWYCLLVLSSDTV